MKRIRLPLLPTRRTIQTKSQVAPPQLILKSLSEILENHSILPSPDDPWSRRLIQSLNQRNTKRISVIGDDKVDQFVTCLFEDPLSSSSEQSTKILKGRRNGTEEVLRIEFSELPREVEGGIGINSNLLGENNADLMEIKHQSLPPKQTSLDEVYQSDITLLHVDGPLTTSSKKSLLSEFSKKLNVFLVLDSNSGNPLDVKTLETLLSSFSSTTEVNLPIKIINTQKAMEALNCIDATGTFDLNEFSKSFQASKIGELKETLVKLLKNGDELRNQRDHFLIMKVLEVLDAEILNIADKLTDAKGEIALLERKISETEKLGLQELNVVENQITLPKSELESLKKELSKLFSSNFNWYNLLLKIDDLPVMISNVLSTSFFPTFQQSLIYKTVKLQSLQENLITSTNDLFKTPSFIEPKLNPINSLSTVYSPTSESNYKKSLSEPSLVISPSQLLSPIHSRQAQLSSPAELLQKRGLIQLSIAGTTLSSSGLIILFAEQIGFGGIEGFASLLAVLGIYRLQRGWEKARKKFDKDLVRVLGGLEKDLGMIGENLIEKVTWSSKLAVESSLKVLQRKIDGLEALKKDFEKVKNMIKYEMKK